MNRVGLLGGGQLGRMLALAAYPLGLRPVVYDPTPDPCAAAVAPHIRGAFEDDYERLFEFARAVDLVTYEFENVPLETVRWLAERVPVYPPPRALEVAQERLAEKQFLQQVGIPTAAFRAVENEESFHAGLMDLGVPAVLKTCRFGYDGKGQTRIQSLADAPRAWQLLGGRPLILEGWVPFDRELSTLAARSRNGEIRTYPLIENWHVDGILHRSLLPARPGAEELQERADQFAREILQQLDYVGLLTIEWFQDGPRLIANEIAPRVHNSGHGTIEAAEVNQFEQHWRAILGWPLGSTRLRQPAVMYNFIGSKPEVSQTLQEPSAHWHDYGKADRPGRKVGHVTLLAQDDDEREEQLPHWDRHFERKPASGAVSK